MIVRAMIRPSACLISLPVRIGRHVHSINASSLRSSILDKLAMQKGEDSLVITSVERLIDLNENQSTVQDYGMLKTIFKDVVNSELVELNQNLMMKIIQLKNIPSDYIVQLFESFHRKNPADHIELDIAMIALRKSLYEEVSLSNALKIIDLTVSSDSYIKHLKKQRNSKISKYLGGGLGGVALVDLGIRSLDFSPTLSIYTMVFAYIFNVSFFGTLAFGSKFSNSTTHIQWNSDISASYKYLHSDEMQMISKVTEIDIELNGVDGYPSDKFAELLNERHFQIIQPESDILIQEYWLSGGDNFEWVEPDQDPAELIWKHSLESKKTETTTEQ